MSEDYGLLLVIFQVRKFMDPATKQDKVLKLNQSLANQSFFHRAYLNDGQIFAEIDFANSGFAQIVRNTAHPYPVEIKGIGKKQVHPAELTEEEDG